jgi:hypothetical protein
MELSDVEKLKKYETENDLVKVVQEIDDKIVFRGYNKEQVLYLVNGIIKIDLLAVKYETREEILHLLCDALSYHDISNCVNWARIVDIKDKLEDDLKEYVEEFILYEEKYSKVYITHRMSTVTSADVIVVLDHGKIAEAGTHSELMEKRVLYERLWKAQADWYK